VRSHLGLSSVLGWRVRQCSDQGVGALLTELGERTKHGLNADTTTVATIEAAVRLHREELVATAIAAITEECTPEALKNFVASMPSNQIARMLDMLSAVDQLLEGPVVERTQDIVQQLCTLIISRINRLKKESRESDDQTDTQRALAALAEAELIDLIDLAPSLLRALRTNCAPAALLQRGKSAVRTVLTAVAGNELHRLVLLGGNAERIMITLEAIALVADDSRRPNFSTSAVSLFEEISYSRLYLTGAVAQQPSDDGKDLVRPFGATHIDGICRTCTTLAWLRALVALRPVLARIDRANEVDELIERVTYNALLVSVGTDPTRWFGPIPHGVDRNEENDLFCLTRNGHRFAPGPWRPNMRSGGTEEQCCAASSLLGFALVPELSVAQHVIDGQATVTVNQLTPGDTIGDGWELSLGGAWPFEGDLHVSMRSDSPITLQIRIPQWHHPIVQDPATELPQYRQIECAAGLTNQDLDFTPTPRLLVSHPLVTDARGCVAMTAGPFIYCLEGADQMGQLQPRQVRFDADGAVTLRRELEHPEAYPTVHATGEWRTRNIWQDFSGNGMLGYRWWLAEPMDLPVDITFVPYYTIANRGLWEMTIWIPLATATE
jgi:DUF1680 family protein